MRKFRQGLTGSLLRRSMQRKRVILDDTHLSPIQGGRAQIYWIEVSWLMSL